jgi:hypothetical protein
VHGVIGQKQGFKSLVFNIITDNSCQSTVACWVCHVTNNFMQVKDVVNLLHTSSLLHLYNSQLYSLSPLQSSISTAVQLYLSDCWTTTASNAPNTNWLRRPLYFNSLLTHFSLPYKPSVGQWETHLASLLRKRQVYKHCWAMLPRVVYCCIATSALRLG